MEKPNIIGIIPARCGSKGVPKKNIRIVGGYPMIAYSVIAGKLAENINRCIVSTDGQEIADIAKTFGADVPFLRPKQYASDTSKDIEFFQHAMDWFQENEGYIPEYWVQLRPTTPLREPEIIQKAINTITNHPEATSLVAIHEFHENPGKMFGLQDGYLHGLCPLDPRPEYFTLPRQEFAPAYFGNGYVDIVKSSTIINYKSCYGPRMLGFEAPDTGEIDVEEDFKKVEFYLQNSKNTIYQYLQDNFDSIG